MGGFSEAVPALDKLFRLNATLYDRLCDEVLFILQSILDTGGIKTHSVFARVKKENSFLEKAARKGYTNPLEQTEDIVGARVICLFRSDLARVKELVTENFEIVSHEDKIDDVADNSFGYMSVHYICRLPAHFTGPRYKGLGETKFEIQCRTILMDAWANVSHHLEYKGEASIPQELRRDFHALAGLFYVADRHFELFFGESQLSQERAAAAVYNGSGATLDIPINGDTMLAYLTQKYSSRIPPDLQDASEFVEEVVAVGYDTIRRLDTQLSRAERAALEYERKFPPFAQPGGKFAAVGLARQGLSIADPAYAISKYNGMDDEFDEYRPLLDPPPPE